jgi:hypothetical protein
MAVYPPIKKSQKNLKVKFVTDKSESKNQITPNFIIGGVYRSATTFYFTYLAMHPDVCSSNIKETGFFIPARLNKPIPPLENYLKYFDSYESQKVIMEASPGYLYGGKLIANKIKEILGLNVKILFILRNPTDRFISFYNMLMEKHVHVKDLPIQKDISLENYFSECLNHYNSGVDTGGPLDFVYGALKDGTYSSYLKEWHEVFGDNVKIVFYEEAMKEPFEALTEVCNWLEIDENFYTNIQFGKINQNIQVRSKFLHKLTLRLNKKGEKILRRNYILKSAAKRIYYFINGTSSVKGKMDQGIKERLNNFYKPHNSELKNTLKETFKINQLPNWLKSNDAQ